MLNLFSQKILHLRFLFVFVPFCFLIADLLWIALNPIFDLLDELISSVLSNLNNLFYPIFLEITALTFLKICVGSVGNTVELECGGLLGGILGIDSQHFFPWRQYNFEPLKLKQTIFKYFYADLIKKLVAGWILRYTISSMSLQWFTNYIKKFKTFNENFGESYIFSQIFKTEFKA